MTAFQRSATACCTAMPPPRLTRSPLKSRLSKPFVCSNALKSVLTPAKNEKRCRASSLTKAAKSRGFGMRMLCAPSLIIVRLFAVSAKM